MVDNAAPSQAMQGVLDSTRARLIAFGNVVLFLSLIPVAGLLWDYYQPHAQVLLIFAVSQLVVMFIWLFLGWRVGADIDSVATNSPATQVTAQTTPHHIPHWTLAVGVPVNFLVVAWGVYLTGGIVNSPLSPYILTMTLLGQYLAVRTSTKVLLVLAAVVIYCVLVIWGGEGPILSSKAYGANDSDPRIAFLITTVVNLGISFGVHYRIDKKLRAVLKMGT